VNNQTQALATLTKHLCPKKRTNAGVRPACRHGRFQQLGRVKTFNVVYDLSAARLKNATLKTPSTALRLQEDYLYDGLANVTQRTQAWDTGSFTETFAYDVLNRLSTSTVSGQAAQTFTFDDTGNITSKTGVGSYAYPAQGTSAVRPHAIQSIPGVGTGNFGYDTNGNLTSIPGVMTAAWTSYDMPQSITKNGTGGTNASTFTYGPEHQRTKQVRSDGLTVVYAGAQEVETKGGAVTVKTYWPYGVGVEIDRPVAGAAPTNELNWMHVDRLGSPIAISDNIGSLRERLAYDAWGKRRTLNGAPLNGTATPNSIDGITDNRGFTGHEMLDLLDLVHMNGRIYDPLFGKFLSADPLIQDPMNGQSYNRYSYVLNNPTNLTDPTGFACAPKTGSNIPESDCEEKNIPKDGNYVLNRPDGSKELFKGHKSQGALVNSSGFEQMSAKKPSVTGGKEESRGGVVEGVLNYLARNMFGGITDNGIAGVLSQPVNTESQLMFNTGGPYPTGPAALCHPNCTVGDIGLVVASAPLLGRLSTVTRAEATAGGETATAALAAKAGITKAEEIGMLRDAAKLKGNFGLGQATATEANELGKSWVGQNYRVATDGKTLVSSDGMRTYRPPTAKDNSPYATTGVQANFERLELVKGRSKVIGNGHLDVTR
jgi:RHS repeat-associated protein